MPSSHLILCHPLFLLPPIPPSIRVFSNESTLRKRWPKYWSFSFSVIPSKEIPGLISFRILKLLGVNFCVWYRNPVLVLCIMNSYSPGTIYWTVRFSHVSGTRSLWRLVSPGIWVCFCVFSLCVLLNLPTSESVLPALNYRNSLWHLHIWSFTFFLLRGNIWLSLTFAIL